LYKSWYMKRIIRELETQSKGKKYVKASKCPKANCPKSVLSGKQNQRNCTKEEVHLVYTKKSPTRKGERKRVTNIKLVENVR